MKTSPLLLGVALVGATVAHAAPVVTIDGFVGRGSEPENGTFTATIEATSDDGDVLVALSVPALIITDGTFSIDLDLEDAVPALTAGEVVSIGVDLGDGLARTVRLGPVFGALEAGRADRSRLARQADLLGDIPAEDLVADTNILAVPAAFANATGVPESIADGVDNGTVDALTGLAITGGVLDVAAGGVTDIAAGTLTGTQIADGSVNSTQLAALSAAKVADGTLTGANFATGAFAVGEVTGTVNVFKIAPGCSNPFTLTTSSGCARRACTGAGDCTTNVCRVACTGGSCENLGTSPSGSTLVCSGTNEGMEFVGRLIRDPTP
jgi:hypothetical protein